MGHIESVKCRKYVAGLAIDRLFGNWDERFATAEQDYRRNGNAKIKVEIEIEIPEHMCKEQWPDKAPAAVRQELIGDRNLYGEAVAPSARENRNVQVEAVATKLQQSASQDVEEPTPPRDSSSTANPSSTSAKGSRLSAIAPDGEAFASSFSANLPVSKDNIPPYGRLLKPSKVFLLFTGVATPSSDHRGDRSFEYDLDMSSVVKLQFCKLHLKRVMKEQPKHLETKYCIIWPTYKPNTFSPALLEELQYLKRFLNWLQGDEHYSLLDGICDRYKQFEKTHPRRVRRRVTERSGEDIARDGDTRDGSRKRPRVDEVDDRGRSDSYSKRQNL
ncbi:hypothetical protein NHQ30_003373 [Ciborinia camelliae]|nr:hypothetical protein NHQ30_003373 [Ciborinia camelliae]